MKKYLADVNQHLEVIDLRDPEWRREKFIRHLNWRHWAKELDDAHWNGYLLDYPDLQPYHKIWFSLLYGLTYSPCLSWVFLTYFPNVHELDFNEVDAFFNKHADNIIWKHEARNARIHIRKIFMGVKEWAGGDIEAKLKSHIGNDAAKNFHSLYKDLTDNVNGFGRFSAWTAIQCLVESCGYPFEPDTMFVDGSTSTRNQWRGVCQWDGLFGYLPQKNLFTFMERTESLPIDQSVIDHIAGRSKEILHELKEILPHVPLTMLNLESMLCEWSYDLSDFYPGIHGIDVMGVYPEFCKRFPDVDFSQMLKAIDAVPSVIRAFEPVFPKRYPIDATGQVFFLNEIYPDMPDMFAEFGIEPEFCRMKEVEGSPQKYHVNGDREERKKVFDSKLLAYTQAFNNQSGRLF